MRSILLLALLLPFSSNAQDTIHVPDLSISHYYTRMMFSDSNSVTLLSIGLGSQTTHSFHTFNLHNGSLKMITNPVVPSFNLKYTVSKLPNIEVGAVSYPNLLFIGERNDSVFLINTKFTQDLGFVETLDVEYLPVESYYVESTQAIVNPDNGERLFFASFFATNSTISRSHVLVNVLPNHQLEITQMDSIESQKLEILHYLKDIAFLDGYYYVTGYNSPLSAIIDTNLNVVDKGNTNFFDPFNADNDYSLRGYVARQVTNDRMAIIGDGYYGNFPPTVKPTIQTVKVENAEIVFEEHTSYTTLDREIKGVEATYPSPSQPSIFITGAEPETFFDLTKSYIYFKKLVEGEEVLYKRYGNDHYYEARGIDIMQNGNIVISGFTINYHALDRFEGFFMFVDQKGDAVVSTSNISESPQRLDIAPVPAYDKIFFKMDLIQETRLEVIDLFGRIVYEDKRVNSNYIDINSLLPGCYLLNVYNQSKRYSNKFIKVNK